MAFFLQQAWESVTGKDQAKSTVEAQQKAEATSVAGLEQAKKDLDPLKKIGTGAMERLASMYSGDKPAKGSLLGDLYDSATAKEEPIDVNNIPGFAQAQAQGEKALNRSQSTRGATGGREQAELHEFGMKNAYDAYQTERTARRADRASQFEMQSSVVGKYISGLSGLADLGTSTMGNLSRLSQEQADVKSASTLGQANTWSAQQTARNTTLTNLAVKGITAVATGGTSLAAEAAGQVGSGSVMA